MMELFDEAQTISDIKPREVLRAQYRALVRMQLFITGWMHERLAQLYREMQGTLMEVAGGGDGLLDGLALHRAVSAFGGAWAATYRDYKKALLKLQEEAGAIAFGGLAALHENYVRPKALSFSEQTYPVNAVFEPQLQAVLNAAQRRIHKDGLQLSQRLWRLDQESLQGIQQVLYNGVANSKSAWAIAKDLEQYLGFGANCPRWTSTRLRLTKKEIASGDVRGLKRGEECRGQGVAYNALRLARNELQIIHAMATDAIMANLPFVEQEQINLSPSHPVDDECDVVVRSGQDGRGIYPKGTIGLPIHVHCLCFKTAVLMNPNDFSGRLKDWMNGAQAWPAMDQYATMIGGDVTASLATGKAFDTLLLWLVGSYEQMAAVL